MQATATQKATTGSNHHPFPFEVEIAVPKNTPKDRIAPNNVQAASFLNAGLFNWEAIRNFIYARGPKTRMLGIDKPKRLPLSSVTYEYDGESEKGGIGFRVRNKPKSRTIIQKINPK